MTALASLAIEWPGVPGMQRRAALRTARAFAEAVFDDMVGRFALPQGVAAMAFLASGFAPRLGAQALGFRRVGEVNFVRGGRLAAGTAVELELRDYRFQSFDALPQSQDQIRDHFGIGLRKRDKLLAGGFFGVHKANSIL